MLWSTVELFLPWVSDRLELGDFHPAELLQHHLMIHAQHAAWANEVVPLLQHAYGQTVQEDHQCSQCLQIFNLPRSAELSDEQKLQRSSLAQIHFKLCPVVYQISVLLTNELTRQPNHVESGEPTAAGRLCSYGTPAQHGPATKRRRTAEQKAQSQTSDRRGKHKYHGGPDAEADGQHDPEIGQRRTTAAKAGFLRLFHADGSRWSGPCSSETRPTMASTNAEPREDGDDREETIADSPGIDHGEVPEPEVAETEHGGSDIRAVSNGSDNGHCDSEWGISLPSLGCHQEEASEHRSEAHLHGQDVANDSADGDSVCRPSGHNEIPLSPCTGWSDNDSMAHAGEHAVRRAPGALGGTLRIEAVEPGRCLSETPLPITEPSGPTAEPVDGQREGPEQGQIPSEVILADEIYSRQMLCEAMSLMRPGNPQNQCFVNAAMASLLWATLSRRDFELEQWGNKASHLVHFIQASSRFAMTFFEQTWMRTVCDSWHALEAQGDPVEFTSHVLGQLQFHGFDMTWESRVLTSSGVEVTDKGDKFRPIVLQLSQEKMQQVPKPHLSIQTLIDDWIARNGMQTALCSRTPLLCLHLDRYFHGDDRLQLYSEPIHFQDIVTVPIFNDSNEVVLHQYQVVSAVSHQGLDQAGHCQALLCTAPHPEAPATRFLLTDDDRKPTRMGNSPWWFSSHMVCCWLRDASLCDLPMLPVSTMDSPDDCAAGPSFLNLLERAVNA